MLYTETKIIFGSLYLIMNFHYVKADTVNSNKSTTLWERTVKTGNSKKPFIKWVLKRNEYSGLESIKTGVLVIWKNFCDFMKVNSNYLALNIVIMFGDW